MNYERFIMKKRNKTDVRKYPYVLSYDADDGIYVAKAIDLKGCHSDGKTPEQAVRHLYEAIDGWLETAKKSNLKIPEPSVTKSAPKKFLLRIDADNFLKLQALSTALNESLNTLLNRAIAKI